LNVLVHINRVVILGKSWWSIVNIL
jgi:hypothetical protein